MGTGLLSTFRILTWRRPHERCYPATGVKSGRRGAAAGPCCPPRGAAGVSPSPPAACSSLRFPFSFGLVRISTNVLPSNFDLLKANAIYDATCDALSWTICTVVLCSSRCAPWWLLHRSRGLRLSSLTSCPGLDAWRSQGTKSSCPGGLGCSKGTKEQSDNVI